MSHDLRQEVRALRGQLAAAKAQLAMAGVDGFDMPRWAVEVAPVQAAILAALLKVHPRGLDAYTLEELSRTRDHAAERDVKIIHVQVCRIRSRFGADAVETSAHTKASRLLIIRNPPRSPMTPVYSLRLWLGCRNPFRRRPPSAPTSNTLIADILRSLRHMEPSADAQAIIDQVNKLPGAIAAEVASEVSTAEAAKDAQRAADIAAIGAAVTSVGNGIGQPAPAADQAAA